MHLVFSRPDALTELYSWGVRMTLFGAIKELNRSNNSYNYYYVLYVCQAL